MHFAQYSEDWRSFEKKYFIHVKQKELLKKKYEDKEHSLNEVERK